MRVLFTSASAIGHVNPMIPLALALRDRGHEIRWATGPDACPRLESLGIVTVSVGVPWEAHRAECARRYPELQNLSPPEAMAFLYPRLFGEVVAGALVEGVIDAAKGWRPDLVVHDAAECSGAIAAASIGVPSVTHSFGALTPISRVRAAAEVVAPLWGAAGLAGAPVGADVIQKEGEDRPFVYLTFGTIVRDSNPIRVAVEAISSLDVRLLVTVGPAGDPEALGPQPGHVRVEHYVPQSLVFDACDVVASHGGSGTFLGALSRGIPQLCLPQSADQFLNAEACRRAGVGLALEPAEADHASIAAAMSRLLAESSFRDRASEVAAEIAAMPDPEQVAAALERL